MFIGALLVSSHIRFPFGKNTLRDNNLMRVCRGPVLPYLKDTISNKTLKINDLQEIRALALVVTVLP